MAARGRGAVARRCPYRILFTVSGSPLQFGSKGGRFRHCSQWLIRRRVTALGPPSPWHPRRAITTGTRCSCCLQSSLRTPAMRTSSSSVAVSECLPAPARFGRLLGVWRSFAHATSAALPPSSPTHLARADVAPKCQYPGGKEYFSTMEACQRTWLLGPWKRVLRRARASGLQVAYILGNGDVASNYDAHAALEREGLCMLLSCRRRPLPWRDGTPSPLQALGYPFAPLSFSGLKDFEKAERPCTAAEVLAAKAAQDAAASGDGPSDDSCLPFEFTPDGAMRECRTHGRRSTKTVTKRRPMSAAAGAAASSGAGHEGSDSPHGVGQRVVRGWHAVGMDADRAASGETIQADLAMPVFRSPATAEGTISSTLTPDLKETLNKGEESASRPGSRERRPSRPPAASAGSSVDPASLGVAPPEAGSMLVSDDDSSDLWLGSKCAGALPWSTWRLMDDFECQLSSKQIPTHAGVGDALKPLPPADKEPEEETGLPITARPAPGTGCQNRTIFVCHSPPWGSALDAVSLGSS